jgi:hypothetical protein
MQDSLDGQKCSEEKLLRPAIRGTRAMMQNLNSGDVQRHVPLGQREKRARKQAPFFRPKTSGLFTNDAEQSAS